MIEQKCQGTARPRSSTQLGATVVRWQDATQRYDEAVGEIYGLGAGRAALPRASSGRARRPRAPSRATSRLTPAAVTALIDRLEKRGFVRRKADPNDRRKVLVEQAEEARRVTAEAYPPLRDAGARSLQKYTEAELQLVADVLDDSLRIQEEMTARLAREHGKTVG